MSCLYDLARIKINTRCKGYYLRWYYNGWHYWLFYPGKIGFTTEGEKYRTLGTQKLTVGSGQITEEQSNAIRTIMNTREIYIYTDSGWGNVRIDPGSWIVYEHSLHRYEAEITITIGSKYVSRPGFSPVVIIPDIPLIPYVPVCGEVVIGFQTWMKCNYDSNYPGSKVYNDDETLRAEYGGLYNYSQIMASGFCPSGWHVPTLAEWQTLIAFVEATSGAGTAGGELKKIGTSHWYSPNTGAVDTYGFDARGTGFFNGLFTGIGYYTKLWTQTILSAGTSQAIQIAYNTIAIYDYAEDHSYFLPVRLIKDSYPYYPVTYGMLYNYYVTTDVRNIANTGWHIPTIVELQTLADYLGAGGVYNPSLIGGKLKDIGTNYWNAPNTGATNEISFNARASGQRGVSGFNGQRATCFIWSATTWYSIYSHNVSLNDSTIQFFCDTTSGNPMYYGMALRPVKDSTVLTHGQTGTYTGNDGKIYRTICIGTQEWVADNLEETKYRNGDSIPEVKNEILWQALTTGARCYYNNQNYSGWYLPSADELQLMHDELHAYGLGGFNGTGSAASLYWSSSEFIADRAWAVYFYNGTMPVAFKNGLQPVRACRSFNSTTSYSVRSIGPGGGYVFYKNGNNYIEAAPVDQSASQIWSNLTASLLGGTSKLVGTGQTNTGLIILQPGHTDSAANLCNSLP